MNNIVSLIPFHKSGDLNLNVVAMALSGYTDEKNSLWREMCSTLRLQLNNPYLCAMFAFLTSESGSYDGVLVSKFLSVRLKFLYAIGAYRYMHIRRGSPIYSKN